LSTVVDDGIVVEGLKMPGPPVTTDQYFRMPETRLPQELVFGLLRDAPAPTPGHQAVVGRLHVALSSHLGRHASGRVWLSPIDVVLDRTRHLVVQPDLIVLTHARLHLVTDRVWGAPDLVIEVMSPRPRIGTLQERLDWFAEYGVREIWLYDQTTARLQVLVSEGGRIQRQNSFAAGEPIVSDVLPLLGATTAQMLGDW